MEKALFKGIKEFIIGKLNEVEKTLHIAVAWFTNILFCFVWYKTRKW